MLPDTDESASPRAVPRCVNSRRPSATRRARFETRGFDVVLISQWSDPRDTDTAPPVVSRNIDVALKPFLGSRSRYMNYLVLYDESDPAKGVYGPNYPRLQELKRKGRSGEFLPVRTSISDRKF